MPISAAVLKVELQKFIDAEFGGFINFPGSPGEFKSKFSAAIDTWLSPIQVISPLTVAPPTGIIGASGCGSAFSDKFTMAHTAGTFHTDFVSGWISMVGTFILTPSGDYLGVGVNPIISITPLSNISGPAINLTSALSALMSTNNTGEEACNELANMVHTATILALVTTCTYTIPSSPPGSGPIAFG